MKKKKKLDIGGKKQLKNSAKFEKEP